MKKSLKAPAVLLLALIFVFALCACGGKNTSSHIYAPLAQTEDPQQEASSSSEEASSREETPSSSETAPREESEVILEESYDSVTDFVDSEDVQGGLTRMQQALEDNGMGAALTAEGSKLVYTFSYAEGTVIPEDAAEELERQIPVTAPIFEEVLSSLKKTVDDPTLTLEVRYTDFEGNVIYSKEFT